jgi:hypothetical protein
MTTNQPQTRATAGTVYLDGARVAFPILLSLVGFGSAMGQSSDQDMWMRGNTLAARDRTVSEVRQARSDGTIKRWSPAFIEIPLKPRRTIPSISQRGQSEDSRDLSRVTSPTT